MNLRVAVRAIILHEGRLLAVRHKVTDDDVVGTKWWALPGGRLEYGESVQEAVAREIFEETGIRAQVGSLLYVHQFRHNSTEALEFFFHITNGADFTTIDLSKTSHGAIEIAEIAFIDPKTTEIYPEFLRTEDLTGQSQQAIVKAFSYL